MTPADPQAKDGARFTPREPFPAPPVRPDPSVLRFDGAVALVVGAAHGIGAATAERLAAEGASVIAADLDADAAAARASSLVRVGEADHMALRLDVTDARGIDEALAQIAERFGRLDVLAHVAGGNVDHAGPAQTGDDTWEHLLDLNLMGPVRTVRAALPLLRRSDRAAIVTISSVNALVVIGGEPYAAAKSGLIAFTQNLAAHVADDGIRANAVAPGTVRTRVWDGVEGGADSLAPLYPLGRVGEPADIAAAVAFLASGEAAWITGVVLPVDGGLLLQGPGPGHS